MREEIRALVQECKYAVEATIAASGGPQAAVVGIVADDALQVFFDTLGTTRKMQNLRRDPRIALVLWEGARTVQYEGIADEPRGDELAAWKARYFARFPDGRDRERWEGIAYVRVRPTWIRFSDFDGVEPRVVEFAL